MKMRLRQSISALLIGPTSAIERVMPSYELLCFQNILKDGFLSSLNHCRGAASFL